MENNLVEPNKLPDANENVEEKATQPNPPEKSFLKNTLGDTPDFKLSSWIAQLLCVVLPSLAIIPLFLLAVFEQENSLSGVHLGSFVVMAVFSICLLGYSVWQIVKKKGTHRGVLIAVSFLYVAWIALTTWYVTDVFNIKSDDPWLMISALAILSVFYCMINIIQWLSAGDTNTTFAKNTVTLIFVPLIWYLLVNTVMSSIGGTLGVISLILTIVATYLFIFLLLRILYLIGTRLPQVWKVTRILLVFVMPILCFVVTQIGSSFAFFWDYTSPMYYLLIILNGVLIMLPEPNKQWQRMLLFLGRCTMYLVVTYFFVVIAPFYSFSLIGLLFAGIGLLVLTPLFLWAYQTKLLIDSAKALFKDYGGVNTISIALAGVLLMPAIMIGSFALERSNFQKALTHMNSLGVASENTKINSRMLEKTIRFMSADKSLSLPSSREFLGGYYYDMGDRTPPPFITALHNKVIGAESFATQLEDMDGSLDNMYRLYVNQPIDEYMETAPPDYYYEDDENEDDGLIPDDWLEEPIVTPNIDITEVEVVSKKEQDYYRSFVNLTLKNTTEEGMLEYSTEIELPEGVFVSGYYLDVLGVRKYGLLSETTSANWIYDTVTGRFLDPGILNYTAMGLSLRVFPFKEGETRYTGIEFLHNEPITLVIDGQEVELAKDAPKQTKPIVGEDVIFVSETLKDSLKPGSREPYYIFAVDCSYGSDVEKLVARVEAFVIREEIALSQASISAINYNRQTWSMQDSWKEQLLSFPRMGGFGYGLMASDMFNEVDQSRYYPVLVVADNIYGKGFRPTNIDYLLQSTPETSGYFVLDSDIVVTKSFENTYDNRASKYMPEPNEVKKLVVEDKAHYLLADTGAEILYQNNPVKAVSEYSDNKWINALNFKGDNYRISMLPDKEESFEAMMSVIKKSFNAGVMSPYTSFIVLETTEQEDAMFRRQKALMESSSWDDFYKKTANSNFMEDEMIDPDMNGVSMSEPSLIISVALLLPLVVIYRKRKRGKQGC